MQPTALQPYPDLYLASALTEAHRSGVLSDLTGWGAPIESSRAAAISTPPRAIKDMVATLAIANAPFNVRKTGTGAGADLALTIDGTDMATTWDNQVFGFIASLSAPSSVGLAGLAINLAWFTQFAAGDTINGVIGTPDSQQDRVLVQMLFLPTINNNGNRVYIPASIRPVFATALVAHTAVLTVVNAPTSLAVSFQALTRGNREIDELVAGIMKHRDRVLGTSTARQPCSQPGT